MIVMKKMMVLTVMMFLLVMAQTQRTTPLVEQLRNLQAQALGKRAVSEESLLTFETKEQKFQIFQLQPQVICFPSLLLCSIQCFPLGQ